MLLARKPLPLLADTCARTSSPTGGVLCFVRRVLAEKAALIQAHGSAVAAATLTGTRSAAGAGGIA